MINFQEICKGTTHKLTFRDPKKDNKDDNENMTTNLICFKKQVIHDLIFEECNTFKRDPLMPHKETQPIISKI